MSKSKEQVEEAAANTAPEPDPQIQAFVARSLQAHYESIVRAPVPDRFLMLLAQLEDQERKSAEDKSDEQR